MELINLIKIYIEDYKYSKENNNFNFKLTIFYNLYSRANIPQEAKAKAYPIILRSLALNYYYTNLKNNFVSTSTIKTLILTLLAINPTLLIILPI